jgi:two-component system sporulation sensor kinase A
MSGKIVGSNEPGSHPERRELQLDEPGSWMAVTFSSEGLISAVSPKAESVTGYSALELAGRSITEILADSSVFKLPEMLETAIVQGAWSGEIRYRRRSSHVAAAFGVLSPLMPLAGRPGYLLLWTFSGHASATAQDRALREVGARLRAFAHELNNPLAVMLGFTQLIMLNPECVGKFQTDITKLYSELKRVIEVVQRLHQYGIGLHENSSPEPCRQPE